ncbi:MAG: serine/threonine-protein kinase [Myxococcota bacterium]
MADAPESTPRLDARMVLDDPVDLQRTRTAVLGAMFGEPEEPTMIGRFEVVATAGRGAMGRVYVAFDPQLDRTVALKLIVDDGDPQSAEERRTRLVGEAQAMAQLAHANVVSVHEVGRHEGDVFIVMQYVAGPSLRRWNEGADRTLEQRVDALRGAARGLAAAHEAGIVHRDFKPDNVLIDDHGRSFVTDFGLAHSLETVADRDSDTNTTLGGTPAYMAPEQMTGASASAASDQFAFGVAAWEVLTGRRPARGSKHEPVLDDDGGAGLPAWLRRVLVRSMATEPAQRWPSMEAVVTALERRGGRTRTLVIGVVTIAAIGTAAAMVSTGPEPCADADASIAAHWNDARRQQLRDAFVQTKLGYASGAAEHVNAKLDAYRERWSDAARHSCHIGREGRWSDTMVDRAGLCLENAASQLRASVDRLTEADGKLVRRATALVDGLPPVDRCLDPEVLMAEVAVPGDDIAAQVRAEKDRIADAQAAFWAGHEQQAAQLTDDVVEAARALDWEPLLADAMFLRAHIYDQVRDVDRARDLYLDAYFLAGRLGYDRVAAQTAAELVSMFEPEQLERAHEWARHARMAIDRSPGLERYSTRVSQYSAWAAMEADELVQAAEVAERAHGEAVESFGTDSEQAGHAIAIAGIVAMQRGDHDEALDRLRQALSLVEKHKPPGHPTVARLLNNMGIVARKAKALDEAAAYFDRSLQAKIDLYGEQHPSVATAYNGLGLLEADRGRFEEAREYLESSLAIREVLLPAEHPDIWNTRDNLAFVALYAGKFERAVELSRRTLEGRQAFGHAPKRLTITRMLLGRGLVGAKHPERAIEVIDAALKTLATHPDPGLELDARVSRAAALLGMGRAAEARGVLEAAADIEGSDDAETEGLRRLLLARSLRELGAPTDEVLGHAHAALVWLDTGLMQHFAAEARALVRELRPGPVSSKERGG